MWVSEACQLFLVPSRNSNTPLYPFKVLWAKERAPTPPPSVVFHLDSLSSPSRSWECVNLSPKIKKFKIVTKEKIILRTWKDYKDLDS